VGEYPLENNGQNRVELKGINNKKKKKKKHPLSPGFTGQNRLNEYEGEKKNGQLVRVTVSGQTRKTPLGGKGRGGRWKIGSRAPTLPSETGRKEGGGEPPINITFN